MIISSPRSFGPWQKTYWEKGPPAASTYCQEKRDQIQRTIALFIHLQQIFENNPKIANVAEALENRFVSKQSRYCEDVRLSEEELFSRGRDEPGRCPFQYPDIWHRYWNFERLQKDLEIKIGRMHQPRIVFFSSCSRNFR
jgi:hypothetical protein